MGRARSQSAAAGPSRAMGLRKQQQVGLPGWFRWWALIASFLVLCDCVYVFSVQYKSFVPSVILRAWSWYGTSDIQYHASGQGINASNGWMLTQSKFNVIEVALELLFLFYFPRDGVDAMLAILLASICTLYKTLLYMSIIAHSSDPVHMVPLLACWGYSAVGPQHAKEVQESLAHDNCVSQAFKFSFNFWWIGVPAAIVFICFGKIRERL